MKLVGIDLGTTNSAIAILNEFGKSEIIPNKEGERVTPSVVLFDNDDIIVGTIAKQSSVADPEHTISCIKNHIGSKDFSFEHNGKEYLPEDISAIILKKLINDAENYLGEKITDAIITVPAYFNDLQRKATIDAGKISGINVTQIINEPTAATLTYGIEKKKNQTILVYDFGGGTFDVTIMKIDNGNFTVIASDGDRKLGGNDFDDKLMSYLNDQFIKENDINLLDDPILAQDLRIKSENAKKVLSVKTSTTIYLSAQGKSSKIVITRELFTNLVADLITRTQLLLEAVIEDAKMEWDSIDQILLVGGTTRIPAITEMIKTVTSLEPSSNINPDEAVALGAAMQTGILSSKDNNSEIGEMVRIKYKDIFVSDVTSHSFGAVTLDEFNKKRNAVIIPKNSKIPIRKGQIFYTTVPKQTSVKLTVLQGEDPDPEFCNIIGTTTLEFEPKKLNSPIVFNYEYDLNGIIHATAKDPETGEKSVIKITREGELSGDEVKMKAQNLEEVFPQRIEYVEKKETTPEPKPNEDENKEIEPLDVKPEEPIVKKEPKSIVMNSESEFTILQEEKELDQILSNSTLSFSSSNEIDDDIDMDKLPVNDKKNDEIIIERASESHFFFDENYEKGKDTTQKNIEIIDIKENNNAQNTENKENTEHLDTTSSNIDIERSEIITDEKIDNLDVNDSDFKLKKEENFDSQTIENTAEGLESAGINDWDKVLKIVEISDENNDNKTDAPKPNEEKEPAKRFVDNAQFFEMGEGKNIDDFFPTEKENKEFKKEPPAKKAENQHKKGVFSLDSTDTDIHLASSEGDILDWIKDDDDL